MIRNTLFVLSAFSSLFAIGCGKQVKYDLPSGDEVLPLPSVSTKIKTGEYVLYRDVAIGLSEVAPDANSETDPADAAQRLRVELIAPKNKEHKTIQDNSYVVLQDILLHVDGTGERAPGLYKVDIRYLPDLVPEGSLDPFGEDLELDQGELKFFPGGFIAFTDCSDGEYLLHDDDRATMTVYFNGQMEKATLTEFRGKSVAGLHLQLRNVYPGLDPGTGVLFGTVTPSGGNLGTLPEVLTVNSQSATSIDSGMLSGEYYPSSISGDRAILTIKSEQAEAPETLILSLGESVAIGRDILRFDEPSGSGVILTHALSDEPARAELARYPGGEEDERRKAAAEKEEKAVPQSTLATKTLRTNEVFPFWGADFQLLAVFDRDRTDISDDVAEIQITYDGLYEVQTLPEGTRSTVRGAERWWVIEVKRAQPGFREGDGEATLEIKTDTFLGATEPWRRGI